MNAALNYREFYQKTPITMYENDRLAILNDKTYSDLVDTYTHWLIALEGNEENEQTIKWRVFIFLTSENGPFNFKLPFFCSSFFRTFNEAYELSQKMTVLAKQDQLHIIKHD
ncbi:hypothetical protein [Bacillus sp. B15-48]|uniref:hypothetical protein n=1 Tax=Bacillus sp. B15-48 TaxID=1548601 RepID=UPI00193FCD69|nr:hypothetical protein [Bacillus sp. B15-48]MBM4762848.1 hypothetical protein [Bacillus sp. B15-48]